MPKSVGDKVTASWGNSVRIAYKRKTTTDSVASNTTAANDAHITFSLAANKVYKVDLYAHADSTSATPDIKFVWAVTGGVAALTTRLCVGPGTATTDIGASAVVRVGRYALSTNVPYGCDGSANGSGIHESFLVETTTAGTAGTLTLQWAQNTSSATATRLTSATYATAIEVESLL